ncbi:MAG: hypothetical protein J5506_03760 [Prevotella sp.]|nr:hypothetical protein [Prevotella sp.]
MAFLINRTAAARIECLHALAQLIVEKYGSYGKPFNLKDVKFDRNAINIHKYCTLLLEDELVGKYCRFKENPLDDAGCSITNGILSDTTKSKEVSNTINAMHALGFVERVGRIVRITSFGVRFAKASYGTADMQAIIKKAVINYGPVIGVMNSLARYNPGDTFNVNEICVGYPSPAEFVNHNGSLIELSAGSTQDSNTRTKSCILAWLTQGGYIKPVHFVPSNSPYPHIAYRDYINSEHRMGQVYEIIEFPNTEITDKPLNYDNLTKMNFCLRENGQSAVREATRYYETKIKNRRFAILFLLNLAFHNHTALALNDIIEVLKANKNMFVVSEEFLEETVSTEIEIAFMAGIPYVIRNMNGKCYLQPTKGINMNELQSGAPQDVINFLNQYSYNG